MCEVIALRDGASFFSLAVCTLIIFRHPDQYGGINLGDGICDGWRNPETILPFQGDLNKAFPESGLYIRHGQLFHYQLGLGRRRRLQGLSEVLQEALNGSKDVEGQLFIISPLHMHGRTSPSILDYSKVR